VSGLFVFPTYPTLFAAVEMDNTGSIRIGNVAFNHPFLIPGTEMIVSSMILAFIFGGMMLLPTPGRDGKFLQNSGLA
jgi:anaerobic C4-dicarboxylate transporter DcuA